MTDIPSQDIKDYRTAVWNFINAVEQGWINYDEKKKQLKELDMKLFGATIRSR